MKKISEILGLSLLGMLLASPAHAQDITNLGGDLTSDRGPETALELPAPNVDSQEKILFHLQGHSDFHGTFTNVKVKGKRVLGPNFNHNSCGACHFKNSRGSLSFSSRGSAMLIKIAVKGRRSDGSPRTVPNYGEQLQDQVVGGKPRFKIKLEWVEKRGKYADGSSYKLRSPKLKFDIPKFDEKKVLTSLRMTPPVVGMGLLEAIPDETIIAMSDPNDANGDGISGKVSYVPNRETGGKSIGRFGFRASHPTVRQQSAAAFFHDMGMTSELFKQSRTQQEVSKELLDRVTFYLQAAGIPPARDQNDPEVIAGKQIFQQINCSGCHKMTLFTGDSPVAEVANQEIHPFTDLLLHDMGTGLADKRAEFSATGREWRTTPLWGIGIHPFLTRRKPGYLHDGRARTLEEAILWHGGEAAASQAQFKALPKFQRDQLIRFLKSL